MSNIAALFDQHGWAYETLDDNLWRSTFFTENEEEFDLYVMAVEDWVHFAVMPFLPPIPEAQAARLHSAMLKFNQQMRIARFALDADGDALLIADAPAHRLNEGAFAQIIDTLVSYTEHLSIELRRLAADSAHASLLNQDSSIAMGGEHAL